MEKTLSQDEVDALLQAIQTGQVPTEREVESSEEVKVVSYNFRKPRLISSEQLRGYQMIHDNFARGLQSGLLMNLRTTLEIKLVAIDVLTYGEFSLSLSNPTYLGVLFMSAAMGEVLVEMNLPIVMAIIDILLGGDGTNVDEPRALTAIELSVSGGLMEVVLAELKAAWAGVVDTEFQVQSYESNPEFIQLTTAESLVVGVTLDLHMGGTTGILNLCYPYAVIQPLLPNLSARVTARRGYHRGERNPEEMQNAMSRVPLDIRAVLGKGKVSTRELCNLKPGDVLCLDKGREKPADVYIGNRLCYRGLLGQRRGRTVVKLADRVKPEDEPDPLQLDQ